MVVELHPAFAIIFVILLNVLVVVGVVGITELLDKLGDRRAKVQHRDTAKPLDH